MNRLVVTGLVIQALYLLSLLFDAYLPISEWILGLVGVSYGNVKDGNMMKIFVVLWITSSLFSMAFCTSVFSRVKPKFIMILQLYTTFVIFNFGYFSEWFFVWSDK